VHDPQPDPDKLAEFATRVLGADPDAFREQYARAIGNPDLGTFRERPVDPYPERILGAGTDLAILDEAPDAIGYYHSDEPLQRDIDWLAEYRAGRAFLVQRNPDGTYRRL
jgi:hypothetical protein